MAACAGMAFPWGDELEPDGRHLMNVFQGTFPGDNTCADGFAGTAPVDAFEPNGFGLYNMTGNVWEWCADWFDPATTATARGATRPVPSTGTHRVMRGGSYLLPRLLLPALPRRRAQRQHARQLDRQPRLPRRVRRSVTMASITWGRDVAETYDAGAAAMFAPAMLEPTVDLLAELAGEGPALELAIETGRVALPLSGRRIAVSGIELSPHMAAQLRAKPGSDAIERHRSAT